MPEQKSRIIIDTNLWISFLLKRDYSLLDWLTSVNKIILLFSEELLEEFITVVQRPKFSRYFSSADVEKMLSKIHEIAVFIPVKSKPIECRDAKDNFLLALAKDGKATHLITGDSDLLVLKKYHKTVVLTMTEFLNSQI